MHGQLEAEQSARAMVVTREVPVTVEELWRWITESERTAQWYGPWRTADGSPATVGTEVLVTMSEEEQAPESGMRVEACEGPSLLRLASTAPAPFDWRLSLECAPAGSGSTVSLRHHAIPEDIPLADLGAGWEFYLERLVCAISGAEPLSFEQCVARYGQQYAALA
ncbi:SRPBCC domain-containing protein [Luteococcus sp. Sow4_B9]|uniref:SRPBCC domain-containing protein n=1 Tax=Luteococcus sp. Sow4_B9 TaxID=3438792 RepID=UPI003F97AB8A